MKVRSCGTHRSVPSKVCVRCRCSQRSPAKSRWLSARRAAAVAASQEECRGERRSHPPATGQEPTPPTKQLQLHIISCKRLCAPCSLRTSPTLRVHIEPAGGR
eukprot:5690325-Prymnesium_polylepis.1